MKASQAEKRPLTLTRTGPHQFRGGFEAMACTCELLIRTGELALARQVLGIAASEALRIEHKFSRFGGDGVCHAINHSNGAAVAVDAETRRLLALADTAWRLSGGLFDITSGVLARQWRFDGGNRIPPPAEIDALLPRVGWGRVTLAADSITLPAGMALDFGGLGKEYAVDRTLALMRHRWPQLELLVNYGGDIAASPTGRPWQVGVRAIDPGSSAGTLSLAGGAVATSGDGERFLVHDGKRLSHILDPRTGYPIEGAPASVTVQAERCTDAGLLATLAMLQGPQAETFLQAQGVPHRVQHRPDPQP